MRRVVYLGALVTTMALLSAPVSAQTADTTQVMPAEPEARPWHVNALVGPSFGSLGTAPTSAASAGFELGNGWSIVGEAGTFRGKPIEGPAVVPGLAPPAVDDDARATSYHYNANIMYRAPERVRLMPYVTAGVGAFRGTMLTAAAPGPSGLDRLDRNTHSVSNVGAGLTWRINDWLGASADYRTFVFNTNGAPRVDRFTTGISLLFR